MIDQCKAFTDTTEITGSGKRRELDLYLIPSCPEAIIMLAQTSATSYQRQVCKLPVKHLEE